MGPPGKRDMTDCHSPATVGESSRRRYEFATSGASLKTTAVRSATNVAPGKTKTRRLRPGFGRSGRAAVPLCPRPEQHAPSESALQATGTWTTSQVLGDEWTVPRAKTLAGRGGSPSQNVRPSR